MTRRTFGISLLMHGTRSGEHLHSVRRGPKDAFFSLLYEQAPEDTIRHITGKSVAATIARRSWKDELGGQHNFEIQPGAVPRIIR